MTVHHACILEMDKKKTIGEIMLDLLLLTDRSQLKRDLNCHLGRYFLSSMVILKVNNIYIVHAASVFHY